MLDAVSDEVRKAVGPTANLFGHCRPARKTPPFRSIKRQDAPTPVLLAMRSARNR